MGIGVLIAATVASTAVSVGANAAMASAQQEAADEAAKARGLADHESRVRAMAWQLRSERIGIGSQLEGYGRAISGLKGGYAGAGGSTGASGKASIKRRVRRNISNIRAQTEKRGIEMGYTRLEFAEEIGGWRQTTKSEREQVKEGHGKYKRLGWEYHPSYSGRPVDRGFGREYTAKKGDQEVFGLNPLWRSDDPEIWKRGIESSTGALLRSTAYGQTKKRVGGFFESADPFYRTGGLGL